MTDITGRQTEVAQPPVPVEDDEIGSEAMQELIRRVERWRRGEMKWIPHEEVIRKMDAERGLSDD